MLHPLYDKECNLIAWLDPGRNIFNTNMDWIAFISNNHVWSSDSGNWLGQINGLVCLDTNGKVFAWSPCNKIAGTTRPFRPAHPFKPARPFRPAKPFKPPKPFKPTTPAFGWSTLSLKDWLEQ